MTAIQAAPKGANDQSARTWILVPKLLAILLTAELIVEFLPTDSKLVLRAVVDLILVGPALWLMVVRPLRRKGRDEREAGERELAERRKTEARLIGQNRVLKSLATGQPLPRALEILVLSLEEQLPGAFCSVLMLDEERRLRDAAGPSLPEAYRKSIDGVEIGPNVGSCGTAAYTDSAVFVEDIATDPLWTGIGVDVLALPHGLRSCWSLPIRSSTGIVVGTFAIYRQVKHRPDDAEIGLTEAAAHLAGLAIERAQALARLCDSEERFRALIEHAHDVILLLDDSAVIRFASPAAEGVFGMAPESLVNQPGLELLHPEDRASAAEGLADLGKSPAATAPQVLRVRHADGTYRQTEVIVTDLRNKPAVGGIVVNLRDVTARCKAETDLERARDAAEFANRAKTEFLATVSHEVRTAMNGILGMADLVLETTLSEEQRSCLGVIHTSSTALLSLLNEILDSLKIEAGKLELDPAPFDPRECVADACLALAARAHHKGLELAFHVSRAVPPLLLGDAGRIRQVLMNLVGNAIKFTESGEVIVEVDLDPLPTTEAASVPETLALRWTVRDTGIGIPEDRQSRIFEQYAQADVTTSRKYGGTGLGLTISSRLVELMGGRLWVESEAGLGSMFGFTILLPASPDSSVGSRTTGSWITPIPARKSRALILERHPFTRQSLVEQLDALGLETVATESPAEAETLSSAPGSSFALVLLDSRLGNGERFAAQGSEVLTLVTAGRASGLVAEGTARPLGPTLIRPAKPSELRAAVTEALQRISGRMARPNAPETGLRILWADPNLMSRTFAVRALTRRGHRVTTQAITVETIREAIRACAYQRVVLDLSLVGFADLQLLDEIRDRSGLYLGPPPVWALTDGTPDETRRGLELGFDDVLSRPLDLDDLRNVVERSNAVRSAMSPSNSR